MTQLVECLRHMEEVRGSSPLLPTSKNLKRTLCESSFRFFYFMIFIVSLQSIKINVVTNTYGI